MRRSPEFPCPANATMPRASRMAGGREGHPAPMAGPRRYAVAASGQWRDEEDGRRLSAGEVHAWEQGTNQTVCGLSLHRSRLTRFAGVPWPDVRPEPGGAVRPRQDGLRDGRAHTTPHLTPFGENPLRCRPSPRVAPRRRPRAVLG
ncbi:hypothetical protein GCM10009549_47850 [Streptomyces thermoalcalitolerans]|uniref:Uncharacterized protein n=1 Tax=Streptomyces thermoalcalitolerans TaxID=65605 RepID=A0ABN1PCY0_9ACTN